MRFLSEKYIMFGVIQAPTKPRLVVVDFTAQRPERQWLHNMEGVFTFGFPAFSETTDIIGLDIQSRVTRAILCCTT
jgi:hypothetical protein